MILINNKLSLYFTNACLNPLILKKLKADMKLLILEQRNGQTRARHVLRYISTSYVIIY